MAWPQLHLELTSGLGATFGNHRGWLSFPLVASALSSAATALGGLLVAFIGPKNVLDDQLGLLLGFSAGIMIYLSFVDMLFEGIRHMGPVVANISFFAGLLLFAGTALSTRVASAMSLHNALEGVSVFFAAHHKRRLGWAVGIAIGAHNIPEGIAVAVPVYARTGSWSLAVWHAALSGSWELIGALVASVLVPFTWMSMERLYLAAIPAAGGAMMTICMFELVPMGLRMSKSTNRLAMAVCAGMLVMALVSILTDCHAGG